MLAFVVHRYYDLVCHPDAITSILASSEPYWNQSCSNTAHTPFRRQQIELCRRIPGILYVNFDTEGVDIFPRLRRYWIRRRTQS